uniref:Pentatricopeptide repeat-containing protein At4g36680, mitochondrial n=1 Tax=Elaeis guineensis var. tenera TaxID=51953 RepID=A0A6I9QBS8_ELAGV|nr:pentatricopeptide repeat-containing protein At4g36680, mitochondrial [Elaeis guineensis]XP_010906104.1 pentatricopeptide repeat-containing protein At4g36680, mitochondrial [Elaeis guineensis]XP_010906105.1 pentatricopeptide repeat-containing protein At4g36680, mitochondrial [Elaeis guineensis]XP_029117062.1 pentatricopeptide repeat-containing protein At4g36680, mitochondrial [Elaeis guineensis]
MAIVSSTLRQRSLLLLRPFSTTTTTTTPSSPTPISVSVAKSRLRKEFDPDRAVSILSSVAEPSASPVSARFAVDLAVRRLARARRFADVETLLESRKSGPHAANEPFLATVILSYGAAGMIDHATRTFDDVPRLTAAPHSPVSFNALLSACIRSKHPRRVPRLFAELSKKHGIAPDAVSYGIFIKALCLSGKSGKAFEILKEMVEEKKLEPTTVIYTTLLDSLYKEGKPEAAEELWKEMVGRGCSPDLTAYNVRVMYRAVNGKPGEVLELIQEMESAGVKPNTITHNYLITCYSGDGQLEEAKKVFKGLRKNGCVPNATTFRILLAQLCDNGDFEAGLEVFKDSMKHNKVPDFRTVRLLVEGLAKGSKVEEAKMVINGVRKRFPEHLVGGWTKVEKLLGLSQDGQASEQVEAA